MTSTAELFRRQGYRGTSLKQVTAAAGAPIGSLYHFFPGGKDDLAEVVIRSSGGVYGELFEMIYDCSADAGEAITNFFDGAASMLESTDYADACPIATIALEVAGSNDRLRQATADVFAGWVGTVSDRLERGGVPRDQSEDLALALVAAIEGGFMLSRAARSPEPMRATGRLMRQLVESALVGASSF